MPPQLISPAELRARAGRVCVALSGGQMFQQASDADARCHQFVEFRLDSLPRPVAALPQLRDFLAAEPLCTAIATCRRTAFGGGFQGTAEEQIALLLAAADAGCALADIEVETAEELGPAASERLRAAGAAVILSWHDFTRTPDLEAVYGRLAALQPDFVKIVPTAQSLTDSLKLIDLLELHGDDGRLVAMSMGQAGVPTRVLGPRYGSAFTFASPDGQAGTAPGQVAASTLRDLYRMESIGPQTTVYAVAGSPIGASLSPLMHNTAFRAVGMDAVYLPLETADAAELLEVVERIGIRGLSITMPLKEAVLPLLRTRSAEVEQMKACNTLLRQSNGALNGFNTDVAGIVDPLEQRISLGGKRVLVLGAGGAARAAVFGLCNRGAHVSLLNRTAARAEALAQEAGAEVVTRESLASAAFDIIINSTPYGMRGKDVPAPITPAEMNCSLFFDLVYNPLETPLMHAAEQRGIQTVPGAAMFVAQGVEQFRIWTGKQAPEEAMLNAVTAALSTP